MSEHLNSCNSPQPPASLPHIKVKLIQSAPPHLPLGVALFYVTPRVGEWVHFQIDGRMMFGKAEWINHYLENGDIHLEVALNINSNEKLAIKNNADQIFNKIIEANIRLYDKTLSHNNAMMLAGYAGLFAIWTFIKDFLSAKASLWIGLLTGLSLLAFVLFEIIAMYIRSLPFIRTMKHASGGNTSPVDSLAALQDGERNQMKISLFVWRMFFIPTVFTGFVSAAILLLNILLKLSDLESWPK